MAAIARQPARYGADAAPRAELRHAVTFLHDFAITTFAVDPAKLAAMLPDGFEAEIVALEGGDAALVSAVSFRNVGFHFRFAPYPRFAFAQLNHRAYVQRAGVRGVFFFGTCLASAFVAVPRTLWKLPWHRADVEVRARWSGERCEEYRLACAGGWGAAELELVGGDGAPAGVLDGFADAEDAAVVLTHPADGWLRRPDGRVATLSVWHAPLAMRRAEARFARFSVFEDAGLVARGQRPHSVLVQRTFELRVALPPRVSA